MPKRSSKKNPEPQAQTVAPDPSVQEVIEPPLEVKAEETTLGKNPAAVLLGRLGGKKGGPARARKLTKEQRSEIAKKAAAARWKKT